MSRMPFWAVFFGAVVVLNAGAFAAYSLLQEESVDGGHDSVEIAQQLRADGLESLKNGDYSAAKTFFIAALKVSGSGNDLEELIQIAEGMMPAPKVASLAMAHPSPGPKPSLTGEEPEPALQADEPTITPPAPLKEVTPSPTPAARRVRSSRGSRRRNSPRRAAAPPPAAKVKTTGTLLVTSQPSGLIVEIDGQRLSGTPVHQEISAGPHEVVIFRGDRRVFERRVSLAAGKVLSLDPDLRAKLEEMDRAAEAVVVQNKPETVKQPKKPEPVVKAWVEPKPVAFGELHVISPNVYGSVFINGEDRGFPPVVIKKLPVGLVKVEIRVDGAVRRHKNVKVSKDSRRKVMFR